MSKHKKLNELYTYCKKEIEVLLKEGQEVRGVWRGTNCPACRVFLKLKSPSRTADRELWRFLNKWKLPSSS